MGTLATLLLFLKFIYLFVCFYLYCSKYYNFPFFFLEILTPSTRLPPPPRAFTTLVCVHGLCICEDKFLVNLFPPLPATF